MTCCLALPLNPLGQTPGHGQCADERQPLSCIDRTEHSKRKRTGNEELVQLYDDES